MMKNNMDTAPAPTVTKTSPKSAVFPVVVLAVVVVCLGVFIILSVRQKTFSPNNGFPSRVTPGPSLTPTLIPHQVLGSMTIKTKDGQSRYPSGKPVTVVIGASSEGKRVVGYDAILKYDAKGFSYENGKSLSPDFQLYSFDRKNYVAFSGIRTLQSKALDSWSSYPLIEAVLMPQQKGSFVFELSPVGKEVSKLVDDKNEVVYPKTMELRLEIY